MRILDYLNIVTAGTLATSAIATDYYVDNTSGSNSNGGAIGAPFETITYGLTQISGGDRLIIRAGTYAERLTGFPAGSSGNPTVIRGKAGETVIIKPNTSAVDAVRLDGDEDYITFRNLVFDGADITYTETCTSGRVGLFIGLSSDPDADNVVVDACEFRNFAQGVVVYGNNATLTDLYIHDLDNLNYSSASPGFHGVYVIFGENATVANCLIHDVADGAGIKLGGNTTGTTEHSTLCEVYGNEIFDSYSGVIVIRSTENFILNNVIYRNNREGIGIHGYDNISADCNKVLNNTIYDNGQDTGESLGYGILVRQGPMTYYQPDNNIIVNNISYSNEQGWQLDEGTNTTWISNHHASDPDFVDAANGDFHLTVTSPCVNAGDTPDADWCDTASCDSGCDPNSLVTVDFDGQSRPVGASYDIGALEYEYIIE